jgi:hypothetical protein
MMIYPSAVASMVQPNAGDVPMKVHLTQAHIHEHVRDVSPDLLLANAQLAQENARLQLQNDLLRGNSLKMMGPPGQWWPGYCHPTKSPRDPMQQSDDRSTSAGGSDRDHTSNLGSLVESVERTSFFSHDGDLDGFPPPPGLEATTTSNTTIMMRGIPAGYTRARILSLFDDHGFKQCYDLVYLPIDFKSKSCFSYAFVNLVSHAEAKRFKEYFQGFKEWWTIAQTSDNVDCGEACEADWSSAHQGLEAHVARYRNSPVLHPAVPDEFKPIIFKDGVRVDFPAQTKKSRAPRFRKR